MVEANGTRTKHEGVLILQNSFFPSDQGGNLLKYTEQVFSNQIGINILDFPNNIDGILCSKSKARIAACKIDTMFTNQVKIILILIVALPTTLMMLQIMWKVCKLFMKNVNRVN